MKDLLKFILYPLFLILAYTANVYAYELTRTGRLYDYQDMVAGDYTGFCRDKEGYVWIGTERGLFRFDGNNYDFYRHDDDNPGSISDNRVLKLHCDSAGRVWVATANGLNLYDSGSDSFSVLSLPSLGFNGYVIDMTEQKDGTVTFVVSSVGLFVVNEEEDKYEAVRYLLLLPEENLMSHIVSDDDGTLYYGTHSGNVYAVEPNGRAKKICSLPNYVASMAIESDGNLLVATVNEIVRVNKDGSKLQVIEMPSQNKVHINSLSATKGISTFVSTDGNGIWKIDLDDNKLRYCDEFYSPMVDLSSAKIGNLKLTDEGEVWIGCNYHGVLYIPDESIPFSYRKLNDAYPDFNGAVTGLDTWKGNVVVGLDKGRIAMYSPAGELIMKTTLPGGGVITSIETNPGGNALIGVADDGVWELDLNSGKLSKRLSVEGNFTKVITCRAAEDDVFVAIDGKGILRWNPALNQQKWLPVDPDGEKLTNYYTTSMKKSNDGKIWITNYAGIACFDLRADSLLAIKKNSYPAGTTFCVAPLRGGDVMLGTSHGAVIFNLSKGVTKTFTTSDGLTDNDIRSIVVDDKGGKWFGTTRGLSHISPDNSEVTSYHGGYGLVETNFRVIRYSPLSHAVYMASNLGVTTFHPDSVPSPGFSGDVKVTGLYFNGRRLNRNSEIGGVGILDSDKSEELRTLKLPYKDNGLALRLSTMDFRDGSNVRYLWRIKGEEGWKSTPPGVSLIYLPHLDAGSHVLEMKAVENNVESEVKTMIFDVAMPWYLSTTARFIYLALLVTLGIMFWLLMKKKRQEKINDARIKFFIDISHDIRSPMTLILSPLETLLRRTKDEETRTMLKTMQRNGQRILGLVNQLLDVRKLEKGKMRLVCRRTNLTRFVEELVALFKSQAEEKHLSLSFKSSAALDNVWIDRDNLDKVMVNLISNAIKYTPENGQIEVRVEEVDDFRIGRCARISVLDTGIGISGKIQGHLFERFYRGRENHVSSIAGTGIGLDLCKRLVTLHHGFISADNRDDGVKGSVFSFRIPLDMAMYADDDLVDSKVVKSEGMQASHENEDQHDASVADGAVFEKKPKTGGNVYRVLIVDDDKEIRDYLVSCLGKTYKVDSAADGNEALKKINDNAPDLIISDVVMPGLDGLSLLRQLKKSALTSHIPVILLSTRNAVADRLAGWDKGADAYIGKPFDIDEMEMMVSTLIDNRLRMKGKYSGKQDVADKIAPPEMKGNDEALMDRIMRIIDKKIDDPELNVENLSREVGISRAHLNRKLKEIAGMSPGDFIRNIRLKRATELLKKSDVEVTQVAYALGFTSQPHFSTLFKKFTGYSPSEYRMRFISSETENSELPPPI